MRARVTIVRTVSHLLFALRIARYSPHGSVSFSTSLGAPCLTWAFNASSAFAPAFFGGALVDLSRANVGDDFGLPARRMLAHDERRSELLDIVGGNGEQCSCRV